MRIREINAKVDVEYMTIGHWRKRKVDGRERCVEFHERVDIIEEVDKLYRTNS